jgi:hypothetical protein
MDRATAVNNQAFSLTRKSCLRHPATERPIMTIPFGQKPRRTLIMLPLNSRLL